MSILVVVFIVENLSEVGGFCTCFSQGFEDKGDQRFILIEERDYSI